MAQIMTSLRWGFLPRRDEDLREPLVRRQGSQVSMRVARGRGCIPGSPGESGLVSRGHDLSHSQLPVLFLLTL